MPIFVYGCPRSGTTLLGAMLGSLEGVVCLPEAQFIGRMAPVDDPAATIDVAKTWAKLRANWRFQAWGWSTDSGPGAEVRTYRQLIEWLAREYARDQGHADIVGFVEHSPEKLSYISRLRRHFDDARYVHVLRDGRAVAASIISAEFGPNNAFQAATYWIARVGAAYAIAHQLGAEKVLHLKFEELVKEPDAVINRVARFVGLNAAADSQGQSQAFDVPSYYAKNNRLIGKPVDPRRIDAWRQELTAREIEQFELRAGDFLQLFGYERVSAQEAIAPIGNLERTWLEFTSWLKRRRNQLRRRRRKLQSAS